MNPIHLFRLSSRLSLFLIPLLLAAACAPAAPPAPATEVDDPVIAPTSTPTQAVTPSPLAPDLPVTVPPTQPAPQGTPLSARLAVLSSRARVVQDGTSRELQPAQSAEIGVDDEIEILEPGSESPQSYSLLGVPGSVNVELFALTRVVLVDAQQSPQGSTSVILGLEQGTLFVHPEAGRDVRLTVQTPDAAITSLTSGAEFDVCRTGELTCVMVKAGVVEVVAQERREVLHAGSAGVILSGRPLSPVVCASVARSLAWEESFRLSADAPALHEEIAGLPQDPCLVGENGLPWNARIYYRDEFSSVSTGWDEGTFDPFTAGYVRIPGARYYQVQAAGADDHFLAFVPNGRDYQDVNIDLQARPELANGGDLLYGIVFRRLGEQYYAFVVSPVTETWYFLKSSSSGLELGKFGEAKRLRGLEKQDTLRVEMYGSTFLFFLNGRFLDWAQDPDYARGEAGLFVQTIGSPEALVNFNALTIWDLSATLLEAQPGENCFNGGDDDNDGLADQADPNCQRPELVPSSTNLPPSPTNTRIPTRTPAPTLTPKPPTSTQPPPATPTQPPLPTATEPPATEPPATEPPATEPPTDIPFLPTLLPPLPTIEFPLGTGSHANTPSPA